jgi:hypothetical protein
VAGVEQQLPDVAADFGLSAPGKALGGHLEHDVIGRCGGQTQPLHLLR